MRKLIALVLLLGLAFGGWYYAGPWLAMKGVRDAAKSNDTAALESRVDFPALRAAASRQVDDTIEAQTGEGRVLNRAEGRIASEIADFAVQRGLTPRGVVNLITVGALTTPLLPQRLRGQEIAWSVERDGFNHFRGVGRFEDGTTGPVLYFERDGLGWTMVGLDLPQWVARPQT